MPLKGLIKVVCANDLQRMQPEDRVKVNGEEAGVVFRGKDLRPVFVKEVKGTIYEMSTGNHELRYNGDGTISLPDCKGKRSKYYDSEIKIIGLRNMGVI